MNPLSRWHRTGPVGRGRRRRFRSLGAVGAAFLLWNPLVPGCDGSVTVNYPLRHDYSLSPGFEVGTLTDCYRIDGEDRKAICRTIEGYDDLAEPHDNRDYQVFGSLGGRRQNHDRILATRGRASDFYGATVVIDGGVQFEGCRWSSPDDIWYCDYKATRHVAMTSDTTSKFVLRKLWDWGRHTGNALGCAWGIASTWYGLVVTLPTLTGCVDGPL